MRASIRRQFLSSFTQDDAHRSTPSLVPPTPPRLSVQTEQSSQSKLDFLLQQYAGIIGTTAEPTSHASTGGDQLKQPDPAIVNNVYKLGVTDLDGVLSVLRKEFDKLNPTDDRSMKFERIAQIMAAMPDGPPRRMLTEKVIAELWNSLDHPPPSLLGELFAYRQADGSFNNPSAPSLGEAGLPYARTIKPATACPPIQPDPELIFDLLMSRRGPGFKPHPSGLSSVFFYLASVIIHDLFKTSHSEPSVSLTSSYLDLSPLYGSNQVDQDKVRTFKDGKLKPDCFAEARILGFPPGVSCLLVLFSRYHNWVVENLARINEGNRFNPPDAALHPPALEEARKKHDNDLFQTGRLIVCGLFVNIILHDYLRVIIGLNRTKSTWCLDPRLKSENGTLEAAVGNHCSFEFNFQRDEKWLEEATTAHHGAPLGDHTFREHVEIMSRLVASIPEQPEQRTFGGLHRGPDGRFRDEDLARLWKESVNDLAGAFGPNNTPPALFAVEVLGIVQARKWKAASFNEFRKFFGLKPASTFEEINPDPLVANRLRALYRHPDFVELYPGLVCKDAKPSMEPGSGLCPPHTLSRAILSDAVVLVRGDRFYTIDYHPQSLTNWGYFEAESNSQIDDGCLFYKLLLRALPNSFKPDSIYAHFPMVTPSTNSKILDSLGRKARYSFDEPQPSPSRIRLTDPYAIKAALQSTALSVQPWKDRLDYLMGKPGPNFSPYGDAADFCRRRQRLEEHLFSKDHREEYETLFKALKEQIRRQAIAIGGAGKTYQIDVVTDFAQRVPTQILAALLPLPMRRLDKAKEDFSEAQMYTTLALIFTVLFLDLSPSKEYVLRRATRPLAVVLGETLEAEIGTVPAIALIESSLKYLKQGVLGNHLKKLGIDYVRRFLSAGTGVCEIAWINIIPAISAFVVHQSRMLAHAVAYYLGPGHAHWPEIQKLANGVGNDDLLLHFALEAIRLNGNYSFFNIATTDTKLPGCPTPLPTGTRVAASYSDLAVNPEIYPHPREIILTRPLESYHFVGFGPHQALGSRLSRMVLLGMFKAVATMQNLRLVPGVPEGMRVVEDEDGLGNERYLDVLHRQYGPFPTGLPVLFDTRPTAKEI